MSDCPEGSSLTASNASCPCSVILSDIRQDILDGYLFVQSKLAQELQKAGSQVNVDGEKTNVQGWSAGGTATVFLVRSLPIRCFLRA
jgi:hypothetical protein